MARKYLKTAVLGLFGFLIVSVHQASVALVLTRDGCTWAADWPKELDEVRDSCRTIRFAAGTQETIYEIVFDDRDTFERLWPVLLSVKTPGGALRLFAVDDSRSGTLTSNAKPTVRIYGPANGVTIAPSEADKKPWDLNRLLEDGKALRASPPWPARIISGEGELPEYIQALEEDGRVTWVPGNRDSIELGFLFRARVDLDLVVDGTVIDLNRTSLPLDGPIIDRRFEPKGSFGRQKAR